MRDTGREEVVYNGRVAEYHTYFVGDEGWGFSVWAHNSCGPTGAAEQTSGLSVVPRSGMTSRTVTAPNGRTLTVYGQAERTASTTPGHTEAMNNLVIRLAATGEYEYACIQRSWRTATGRVGTSRDIPDVIGVRRDGRVDAWEVRSRTDLQQDLLDRLNRGRQSLPPERRGTVQVLEPEPPGG